MTNQNTSTPTDSGLIIGFSGTYYCLWSWITEYSYSMTGSGAWVRGNGYAKYSYIKRISTDLEKVKQLYPQLPINESIHGEKWEFNSRDSRATKRVILTPDVFPYGFKCEGDKIMECEDPKILWALYLENNFDHSIDLARSQVYARRRLAELGLLIRYNTSKTIVVESGESITIRKNYCSPQFAAKLELSKSMNKGHFYQMGEKVKIAVKEISSFSFETQFGKCYIINYIDAENRFFKYKGTTPPSISTTEFVTIQATIKHDNYKGQDETLLQRVKIL
jgi:hypothetical protein